MALPAIWNGWVLWEGDEVDQVFRIATNERDADGKRLGEDLSQTPFGKAEIRAKYDDDEPMATFTVTVLDQSDPATRGQVRLQLPVSEADKLRAGVAYWDVQLAKNEQGLGRRTRIAGKMKIKNQATFG